MNRMVNRMEDREFVALAFDKQKLIDWYEGEKAPEPYKEAGTNRWSGSPTMWMKTFKKGSELEWFNPLDTFTVNYNDQGIIERWVPQGAVDSFGGVVIQ